MVVCSCQGVNDTRIRATLAEGAADEFDVGTLCGAGTRCGGCLDEVRRLCAEAGSDIDSVRSLALAS